MMAAAVSPEALSWIVWLVAGLVAGAVAAMAYGGRRLLLYDLLVGAVASLCGGYICAVFEGDDTPQLSIISILCAVFLAGIVLWVFNAMLMRNNG